MDAITADAIELSRLGRIRLAAYPFTDDVPFARERRAGAAKEQRMIAADSFNTPFGGERSGRGLAGAHGEVFGARNVRLWCWRSLHDHVRTKPVAVKVTRQ